MRTTVARPVLPERLSVSDLIPVQHVQNFFVLRNRLLRIPLDAFGGQFVASPEATIVDSFEDAQEFGLPLLALVRQFHVVIT